MRVNTFFHTLSQTHTHTQTHTYTHTHKHAPKHTDTHADAHTRTHKHTRAHTHTPRVCFGVNMCLLCRAQYAGNWIKIHSCCLWCRSGPDQVWSLPRLGRIRATTGPASDGSWVGAGCPSAPGISLGLMKIEKSKSPLSCFAKSH